MRQEKGNILDAGPDRFRIDALPETFKSFRGRVVDIGQPEFLPGRSAHHLDEARCSRKDPAHSSVGGHDISQTNHIQMGEHKTYDPL